MFYTDLFFTKSSITMMPDVVTIPASLNVQYAGKVMRDAAINNTASLLIIAPLIVMYLFCQRKLVQGIEHSGFGGV